ncbi:epoxyqueuosine reductase QueH [Adlercreutzia sp. ZJ154]|uniref:epoxyqueuosine reductase QueH n=1 Tax=Adlercreutzia sp. ZJ154 TaxID=2709790 RepID=UPI001F151AFB|nr:epoxyqueuosine reductase QueH [Adlercreutzia sp. ZJ154]
MISFKEKPAKLLLHACCGPCSMEPVRLLRERGVEPHIYYANSNIAPAEEYEHRRDTIVKWANEKKLEFTEGEYTPEIWKQAVANSKSREARCRACYRMRFEESAAYAKKHGFDALGTTLSVSPYQYTQIIREELERACRNEGIACLFEDYSPYYSEATRRSKEAGMYRQNYCGCLPSKAEADKQRAQRKAEREAKKAARAKIRQTQEQELQAKRQQRAEYDAKQARKRAILKELRRNSNG